MIWENALLGLIGGIARACVGLVKAMRTNRKIIWSYTITSIITSGVIGATAGMIFNSDTKMSIVAGYIGTDLLENTYKIILRKQQL